MLKSKVSASDRGEVNTERLAPLVPFYSLKGIKNDGSKLSFSEFRGKKVLLVNTASDCGFTPQYDQLQELHARYGDKLVLLGFPANDFKEQEKGSDEDIAEFCRVNFGVSFTLMKKSSVVKGPDQNEVFSWLSHADKNGWNDKEPTWNFTKYLVDHNGTLTHMFSPGVSPLAQDVVNNL